MGPWMARRRMGAAARLGPQTVVGLPPAAVVGLASTPLVGLPQTPVVGMAAPLVVAAALRVGLVSRGPDKRSIW